MTEEQRIARLREVRTKNTFELAREKHAKNKARNDLYKASKTCDEMNKPLKKSGVTVIINDPAGDFEFRFHTPYLSGSRMASQRTRDAYLQAFKAFIEKECGKCLLS
jgi:hypothetical protein